MRLNGIPLMRKVGLNRSPEEAAKNFDYSDENVREFIGKKGQKLLVVPFYEDVHWKYRSLLKCTRAIAKILFLSQGQEVAKPIAACV